MSVKAFWCKSCLVYIYCKQFLLSKFLFFGRKMRCTGFWLKKRFAVKGVWCKGFLVKKVSGARGSWCESSFASKASCRKGRRTYSSHAAFANQTALQGPLLVMFKKEALYDVALLLGSYDKFSISTNSILLYSRCLREKTQQSQRQNRVTMQPARLIGTMLRSKGLTMSA